MWSGVIVLPDLRIATNHFGHPEPDQSGNADAWQGGIERLRVHKNVVPKLSGLWTIDKSWHRDQLRPFVIHALESLEAHRVMYGSNLPVEKVNTSAADQITVLTDILSDVPREEIEKAFSGTAKAFYRV